jgi:hypothetical protein
MKELSKEELLKLAENFIKGLPLSTLFDDIPEGLQRELKDFRDAFRGFVPAERFPRAFLFFSGELDWRPKRFLECRKELLDSMKSCKRDSRDFCLSPSWLKERSKKCYLCPLFEDDPEEKVNLPSDEFIEEWYDCFLQEEEVKWCSDERNSRNLRV